MKVYKDSYRGFIKDIEYRKMLFIEETNDLFNNADDYVKGTMDLKTQLNCLEIAKNGSIEEVIDRLNSSWGYNIETITIDEETVFYMGIQIMKILELEKEYLLIDEYYDEIRTNLMRLYLERFNNKDKSLLDDINDFINEYKLYIVGRLYENGIVEKREIK